jgi:D-alanyl-D-alanine dipeptidase
MVRYQNLLNIAVDKNREGFIFIDKSNLYNGYRTEMNDMRDLLKNRIFARAKVYKKLLKVQKSLTTINPSLFLYITYCYRSIEIQTKLFLKHLSQISKRRFYKCPLDLYEAVHEKIAVPTVAGHPTGGAVDLLIKDCRTGLFLDFGSNIYDFESKKSYFFSDDIGQTAKQNRYLLRKIMIKNGFAPYDGEWWHFSYGDFEWAYYYKKQRALYDQVNLKTMLRMVKESKQ